MPSQGVCVVVLSADNRQVLLHKREDFRIWCLPGGGMEVGESWQSAAVRETFEETGYEIEVERQTAEYWYPQWGNGGDLTFASIGRVIGGTPIKRGPETLAVRWCEVDKLPRLMTPFHRTYVADALANQAEIIRRTLTLPRYQLALIMGLIAARNFRNKLTRRL